MEASAYAANTHLKADFVCRAKMASVARQGRAQLHLGIFLTGKPNHDQVILHAGKLHRPMASAAR